MISSNSSGNLAVIQNTTFLSENQLTNLINLTRTQSDQSITLCNYCKIKSLKNNTIDISANEMNNNNNINNNDNNNMKNANNNNLPNESMMSNHESDISSHERNLPDGEVSDSCINIDNDNNDNKIDYNLDISDNNNSKKLIDNNKLINSLLSEQEMLRTPNVSNVDNLNLKNISVNNDSNCTNNQIIEFDRSYSESITKDSVKQTPPNYYNDDYVITDKLTYKTYTPHSLLPHHHHYHHYHHHHTIISQTNNMNISSVNDLTKELLNTTMLHETSLNKSSVNHGNRYIIGQRAGSVPTTSVNIYQPGVTTVMINEKKSDTEEQTNMLTEDKISNRNEVVNYDKQTRRSLNSNSTGQIITDPRSRTCCFCWCCCCSCSCIRVRQNLNDSKKRTSGSNDPQSTIDDGTVADEKITLEELWKWAESFDLLMRSPGGQKSFREFLRSEYSEENIMFWLACEEIKKETNLEIVEEKARLIYEDFISILSPREVSLDSRVRELINTNMIEPSPHIFDEAQLQIYTLMHRDSYPRFLNSRLYKDLLQEAKDTQS